MMRTASISYLLGLLLTPLFFYSAFCLSSRSDQLLVQRLSVWYGLFFLVLLCSTKRVKREVN